VAARSKAWVCGRCLVGIVDSNPAGGMDDCLLWVLSVVRYRSLRRADRSSRGVLPSVVCLSVIVNPRQGEALAPMGLLRHGKRKTLHSENIVYLWCQTIRFLAVRYGWTALNRTKVKYIFVHTVVNLQKSSYKKCHSWTRSHRSRNLKCVLKPCFEAVSELIFKPDCFPRFRCQACVLVHLHWGASVALSHEA
jgi:hypothetical protein